jgi:GTP cyclohydrolase I
MSKPFINSNLFTDGAELILSSIYGDSWRHDLNLKDTPKRIYRAWQEFLEYEDKSRRENRIAEIFSKKFPTEFTDLIFTPNINVVSMCPHHFLPVTYNITVAYIPSDDGYVLGASKLYRLSETLAKRAILQETLTHEIGKTLHKHLKPLGVAVVISGKHGCMITRGIKNNGTFETSRMTGAFIENSETRSEFFSLLSMAKRS